MNQKKSCELCDRPNTTGCSSYTAEDCGTGYEMFAPKMPKSYEKLIGNIIDWSNPNWGDNKVFKVVVANIDPDLGISLVNPDDPKDTFTCLHGPSSPLYHEMVYTKRSSMPWEERFKLAVGMISSGHWEVEKYSEMIGISGLGSSCYNPTCVFTM